MECRRYCSGDGTVVLFVKIAYGREFYAEAAEAFAASAEARLYPAALAAYEASPDRRKRYRFAAWYAEFSAVEAGDDVDVTIAVNGVVLRRERHRFDGALLSKCERIS